MIIHDLDLLRPLIAPPEYDPQLIVYSDRMLASEVPSQSFQSVARRRHKVTKHCGVVQLHQFSAGDLATSVGNPFGTRRCWKISAASVPRKLLIIAEYVSCHDTRCNSFGLARSAVGCRSVQSLVPDCQHQRGNGYSPTHDSGRLSALAQVARRTRFELNLYLLTTL